MDDLQDLVQASIQRLKAGDIGGLETLVTCFQGKALRVAFLITQDGPAAEDVVQDTFIRICQHIRRYDERLPFEPYLLKSVVNAALNSRRHPAETLDGDPAEVEALLDHSDAPETQVEARQLSREILAALARLSPRQRAAIVQRYYLEMSEQEMAHTLQAAPGTIKWLLHAARARLRNLLHPERSIE